jgi:hypothetical protein
MPSPVKSSDSSVIASIMRSPFADQWRKMSREQRSEVLETLNGRSDDDSIRSAFLEVTTGQKALF